VISGRFIVGMAAVLALVPLSAIGVPQQARIEGEVVQVFPSVIVMKNELGHATVLQLTPRTHMDGSFKPGDKIVAFLTPYGVSSVQLKASTALFP
jgi:hypothetical protein